MNYDPNLFKHFASSRKPSNLSPLAQLDAEISRIKSRSLSEKLNKVQEKLDEKQE